jgi:hypothetical protein
MWSVLGHRVVWYMIMIVLEENCWCVFTGSRKMEALCPDQNLGIHQSDYTVP